ncbi:MAG: DUF2341 domain-containing protein, partial [Candidatus Aenigmarchaeota archaeon]|nr:DUF2341 domain-containing protein [Candidatus Aenigmarchaeota archaeon]
MLTVFVILLIPAAVMALDIAVNNTTITGNMIDINSLNISPNVSVNVSANITNTTMAEMAEKEQDINSWIRSITAIDSKSMNSILNNEKTRVIVKFKHEKDFDTIGFQKKDLEMKAKGKRFMSAEVSKEGIIELANDPDIESIRIDQPVSLLTEESAGIIHVPEVQDFGLNGTGVKVCLVDTGVDYIFIHSFSHGRDFVNDDNDPWDDHGHGTEVASILESVAPGIELVVAKVIDRDGIGYESEVLEGLEFCNDYEAEIISLSIGSGSYDGYCDSDIVAEYCNELVDNGRVVVAATGNDGFTNIKSPACASKVIRVSASTKEDRIASFSNVNYWTDIFAPGKDIEVQTMGGSYLVKSGTSLSVPFVSGTSALLLENSPMTPSEVKNRLKTTGDPITYNINTTYSISIPRVNAYNAVMNITTEESEEPEVNESENETANETGGGEYYGILGTSFNISVDSSEDEIVAVIESANVYGKLTDEYGTPIPDTAVNLYENDTKLAGGWWWNSSFSRCKTIHISNAGSTTLYDFPAYINLSYDPDMQTDFDDIRFVNASCYENGVQIDHEIEKNKTTYADVWVRIPELGVDGANISVYYGNPDVVSGENASGVWDENYVAVYHMAEDSAVQNATDSTSNGFDGIMSGAPGVSDGFIDGSRNISHLSKRFSLTSYAGYLPKVNGTVETLVRRDFAQPSDSYRFIFDVNTTADKAMGLVYSGYTGSCHNKMIKFSYDDCNSYVQLGYDQCPDNSWCFITASWSDNNNGNFLRIYNNGTLANQSYASVLTTDITEWVIADSALEIMTGDTWDDLIDEFRISDIPRSSEWINMSYQIVDNQGSFVSFSQEVNRTDNLFTNSTGDYVYVYTPQTDGYFEIKVNATNGTLSGENSTFINVNPYIKITEDLTANSAYSGDNVTIYGQASLSNGTVLSNKQIYMYINETSTLPEKWWNHTFKKCMNVTIYNPESTSLSSFPAYVKLSYDSDMLSNFDDIRFVNTSCGVKQASLLDFELDSYTAGTSANYWVRIPTLAQGYNTISVYYDNITNVESAENPDDVYDSNFVSVYNMETTGGWMKDSANGYNGTIVGGVATTGGVIGNGYNFYGGYADIDDYASKAPYTIGTMELWMDRDWSNTETNDIYMCSIYREATTAQWIYQYRGDASNDFWNWHRLAGDDGYSVVSDLTKIPQNSWTYVALVFVEGGTNIFYTNGIQRAWDTAEGYWNGTFPAKWRVGTSPFETAMYDGQMDVVRFSKSVRTPQWINMSYKIVSNQSGLVGFSNESWFEPVMTNSTGHYNYTFPVPDFSGSSDIYVFKVNSTYGPVIWGENTTYLQAYPKLEITESLGNDRVVIGQGNVTVYGQTTLSNGTVVSNKDLYLYLDDTLIAGGYDEWWNSSFPKCRDINITYYGSSNLTDFPAFINLTYDSDMQPDFDDIRFVDSDCDNFGSEMAYEIENKTDGSKAEIWVRIPKLVSNKNTTISVYYGNPNVGSGQNVTGVWDEHYVMVYHMDIQSSTQPLNDSTKNGYDAKVRAGTPDPTTGPADGATFYNLESHEADDYASNLPHPADNGTIEFWFYRNFDDTNNQRNAMFAVGDSEDNVRMACSWDEINKEFACTHNWGWWNHITIDPSECPQYQWCHLSFNWEETNTNFEVFFDGVSKGVDDIGSGTATPAKFRVAGTWHDTAWSWRWKGGLDEFRVSDINRSYDWVNQTFRIVENQDSYVNLGSEEDYLPPLVTNSTGHYIHTFGIPPVQGIYPVKINTTYWILSGENATNLTVYPYIIISETVEPNETMVLHNYISVYGHVNFSNGTDITNYPIGIYINGTVLPRSTSEIVSIGNSHPDGWWNYSWLYRTNVNITETDGVTIPYFPVNVSMDTQSLISEGRMKSDCSDIRVIYDGAEIPWTNGSACNSADTRIWFEVNLTASSSENVYIYYGNSEASYPDYTPVCMKVDGDVCYVFYDDFSSGPTNCYTRGYKCIDHATNTACTAPSLKLDCTDNLTINTEANEYYRYIVTNYTQKNDYTNLTL